MKSRKRLFPIALVAVLALAGGTAWAVKQEDPDVSEGRVPTSGVLIQDSTPTGASYTVSAIDPSTLGDLAHELPSVICTEISTESGGTQSCAPEPDADWKVNGQPWRPSYAALGTHRFFVAHAPAGVTAMEVSFSGDSKPSTSRTAANGSAGKLLVVVIDGEQVTSKDPASSLDYEVRLLDANGATLHELVMGDSIE